MYCPKCGKNNKEEAVFCSNCGKKFRKDGICPSCNAVVGSNETYCSNCGTTVNEDVSNKVLDLVMPIVSISAIILLLILSFFPSYKIFNGNYSVESTFIKAISISGVALIFSVGIIALICSIITLIFKNKKLFVYHDLLSFFISLYFTIAIIDLVKNYKLNTLGILLFIISVLYLITNITIIGIKAVKKNYEVSK